MEERSLEFGAKPERKNPKEAHKEIQSAFADEKLKPVAVIYTDGSGHSDGFFASAAHVTVLEGPVVSEVCCAGGTHGSVELSELFAVILALRFVHECREKLEGFWVDPVRPPAILWYTDRESLAMCCWKPSRNGPSFFTRRHNKDLWCAYEFFERMYRIYPVYTPRNTMSAQADMDHLAGRLRANVKILYQEWSQLKLQSIKYAKKEKDKEDIQASVAGSRNQSQD